MKYDSFQREAIQYIQEGHSVLVSAPTGAGKTVIAEHVIRKALESNKKVIYTAPIKALSNQKYRDFKDQFKSHIGILTGDVTINPHASTLIMTTEIFRNKILQEKSSLNEYAWIIYDEIHYLDDFQRGTVWEESLIFLPDHMNILGLSATIPNIEEFRAWLELIHHRPIKVIKEDKRPVPLEFYFQCQGKIYNDIKLVTKHGYRNRQGPYFSEKKLPSYIPIKPNRPNSLIQHLEDNDLLPAIYFVFSRKRTEILAEETLRFNFLDQKDSTELIDLFDKLLEQFEITEEASAEELRPFIKRGIAYHHAGMLPTLKEVVERLFTTRMIKIIFTTETFALGINMPARTVIFDELRKFYGRSFATLKTRDFYQMAGRAGRRSIDDKGYVFCRVNPHYIAPGELKQAIYNKPEKVTSKFNASYATLLNLYQQHGDDLYDIYPLTFHYHQEKKQARQKAVTQLKQKVSLLYDLGHIHKKKLTEKGIFATKMYGYELLLSELFDDGFLLKLSAVELGLLCLAIVYEPRKGARRPELNRKSKFLSAATKRVIKDIQRMEKNSGIMQLSKPCFYHLSPCLEEWIKGASFDTIFQLTDADEGEIVRYFRMTIQVLRDLLETPLGPELSKSIHQVIELINRDVIDAEKQLRS